VAGFSRLGGWPPRATERHRARSAGLIAGAALLLCLGGCGGARPAEEAPEVARSKQPTILSTVHADEAVGEEVSEEVAVEIGIVHDPELDAYLAAVGRRLTRHAPGYRFTYTFGVIDQDTPNAFALPGGYIFVSRGLLVLANSEDELANVLAHEIIHVARRHAAARQLSLRDVPAFFQWLQVRDIASYSRRQEAEADRLGQGLAALAGYDPGAMATFLRSLDFTERLHFGSPRIPSFLDTHPATSGRNAAAAERAARIAWQPREGIRAGREGYLDGIEGIVVGSSAAEGVFRGSRFIHPDLAFTLRFPEGWETRNTRRAVGATSPARDAQVFLEYVGEGKDPEKTARRDLEKFQTQGLQVKTMERVKLAGGPAVRVTGRTLRIGGSHVVLTWITQGGSVYRLTGVSSGPGSGDEALFLNVARSFRSLPRELRAEVSETHLRIADARAGESLGDLSRRTGNAWDVQRTAVMNEIFSNELLESGQRVKIAIRERYRPGSIPSVGSGPPAAGAKAMSEGEPQP
jgi:predicted Zn-dependent protease